MSRIALVAGPDAGHAIPVIAIGHELLRRGHDVTMVTGTAWQGCGLPWRDLPLVDAPEGETLGERLWLRSIAMTGPLVDLLRPLDPELVVVDTLTMCGPFAAGVLRMPWVEVLPHPLQNPSAGLPPSGHGLRPGSWWLTRARDGLLRRMTAPSIALGVVERDRALAALGLTHTEPRLRLIGTLPALEHPRPDWRGTDHVVGALEWEPAVTPARMPEGEGPLIVAASSTAGGVGYHDLLGLTVEAARGLRGGICGPPLAVRVAATTVGDPTRELPPWAVLSDGRQTDLLDRAAVLVCGAGGGITAKALRRGVPLVCVPGMGDQKENAGRVVQLGAGVRLLGGKATVPGLRAALQRVLADERFTMAAQAVGRTGVGLGPGRAADLIEGLPL